MAVLLPSTPTPRNVSLRLLSNALRLAGPMGGVRTRVARLGARFAYTVEVPAIRYADALAWMAALAQATTDTALYPVRQEGLTPGSPGNPLVNGAGQTGTTLVCDTFRGNYRLRAGQLFSLVTASTTGVSRRYLHMVTQNAIASGAGAATLSIWPMLRVSPADNATLEFGRPYIEGFLADPSPAFDAYRALANGFSFTIEENE